jgi:hypothetical protein
VFGRQWPHARPAACQDFELRRLRVLEERERELDDRERELEVLRLPDRGGTRLPLRRALDKPIAIACFRLFTFPPLPPFPLLAVPRLYLRISLSTSFEALLAYFLAMILLRLVCYCGIQRRLTAFVATPDPRVQQPERLLPMRVKGARYCDDHDRLRTRMAETQLYPVSSLVVSSTAPSASM